MTATPIAPPSDWREARRLRAWEPKRQGWQQRAIAAAMGVTPRAVSQSLKRARDGGTEPGLSESGCGFPPKALDDLLGVRSHRMDM